MANDNIRSVILTSAGPTKTERESANVFWDRLHREERLRKGIPEAWPLPRSLPAPAPAKPGPWGDPVQRLDTQSVAQAAFTDVEWSGDVSRETVSTIAPPATKPDLASWGTPVLSANLEAEQDKRTFSVEESKTCPPGAWSTK